MRLAALKAVHAESAPGTTQHSMPPHSSPSGNQKGAGDAFGDLLGDAFGSATGRKNTLNALKQPSEVSESWSAGTVPEVSSHLWDFDALDAVAAKRSRTPNGLQGHDQGSVAPKVSRDSRDARGPTRDLSRGGSPFPDALIDLGLGQMISGSVSSTEGRRTASGKVEQPRSGAVKSPEPWDVDFLGGNAEGSTGSTTRAAAKSSGRDVPVPGIRGEGNDGQPGGLGAGQNPRNVVQKATLGGDILNEEPLPLGTGAFAVSPNSARRMSPGGATDFSRDSSRRGSPIPGRQANDSAAVRGVKLAGAILGMGQQLLSKAAATMVSTAARASSFGSQSGTDRSQPVSWPSTTGATERFVDSSDDDNDDTVPAMRTPPAPERRVFVDRELLRAAEELRSRGNELFRAGRFAESEVLYSDAIGLLPKGASELLNLHNNRAVARYKMGEYLLCTEDCTQAQILEPGESKSLLRRAMAWEGLEKWSRAIADYNQLLSSQPGLSGAVQGLSRCRKAEYLASGPSNDSQEPRTPVAQHRERAPSRSRTPTEIASADPFAGFEPHFQSRSGASTPGRPQALDDLAAMVSPAVERLKLEEASAALREAEQSTLKDAVDSKIAAWLGKRENNIRALLSSLDQVLWPELGVQNSALSDLMTPAQVKKHYMRVITRTHPDKIHPDESTERKMIASAVFAALNGAYASFDQ